MRRQDRLVAPWLRSSMMHEQGLEASGYYRKRGNQATGTLTITMWIVTIAGVIALASTCHRADDQMDAQIDKREIMQRQEVSEAQHLMNQELWILREAKNSSAIMDSFHVMAGRE